jgi:mono/diheme cytochrome c family protein
MKKLNMLLVFVLIGALAALLVACGQSDGQEPETDQPEAEHEETEEHGHGPEEHMTGTHDIPAEAEAVENPQPATEQSIVAGATLFAQNCAVCHGETGEGDGPTASELEVPPADLHEEHVQENSDGALFWIVSHGVPESPMPPWDDALSESERWHLVNYLRTFAKDE